MSERAILWKNSDELAQPVRLQHGDAVPHFTVRTVDGGTFSYRTVWQHKNLLLVTLTDSARDDTYAAALNAVRAEFGERQAECVVTRDQVIGLPAPGVLVADRWGEVMYVVSTAATADLPSTDELLEWFDYVAKRCPECEGEAR